MVTRQATSNPCRIPCLEDGSLKLLATARDDRIRQFLFRLVAHHQRLPSDDVCLYQAEGAILFASCRMCAAVTFLVFEKAKARFKASLSVRMLPGQS